MISCKRASELMSKELDERLSFAERISLFFHNRICSFCRLVKAQFTELRSAVRELAEHADECLTEKARDRIIEAIRQNQENH